MGYLTRISKSDFHELSFRNFSKSEFRVIEIRLCLRHPRWLLLSIENYFQQISRSNISLETNPFYFHSVS